MATGGFDDSYAYCGGVWPADQSAKGTVHKNPAIDTSTNHEVEVFLRMADTANSARGYEINYAYDGQYATLVRWNGPHSGGEGVQWTTLIDAHGLPAMSTGDTLSAQIIGSTITAFRNGTQILQFTDSTWSDGAPGMAFFHGLTADSTPMSYYSFSSFEAQGL
jgi:hypothetical protein